MAKRTITTEELPGNSNVKKIAPIREDSREVEEVKNIERPKRVLHRKALLKKKTFVQSIAESIVGENVGGYILQDVLIPAFKNTVQEMVTSGIEMLLFGERRSKSRDRDRGSTRISYNKYYRDRDDDNRRDRTRATYKDRFDLSEIYFKDGRDADDVLSQLCDDLEEYDSVSVADFFDAAGISGAGWAHNKYGWKDLRQARCTHTRGGYQIIFPDPIELD